MGNPSATASRASDPSAVLGAPDYNGDADTNYLCLGSYGSVTLRFDMLIPDGDGVDMNVFEIGNGVKETIVEVSNDLSVWHYVGDAEGAASGVDMSGFIPAGEKFTCVRIADRDGGSEEWPGANIDAVAAFIRNRHPRTPFHPRYPLCRHCGKRPGTATLRHSMRLVKKYDYCHENNHRLIKRFLLADGFLYIMPALYSSRAIKTMLRLLRKANRG